MTQITKQTIKKLVVRAVFVGSLASLFIAPYIFDPYVRVPGNSVELALPCAPARVQIKSVGPTPILAGQELRFTDPVSGETNRYELIRGEKSSADPSDLTLNLRPKDQDAALADFTSGKAAMLWVEFAQQSKVLIQRIALTTSDRPSQARRCPPTLSGNSLRESISSPTASTMRHFPVQEKLSDLILVVHETVSNVVIFSMLAYLVWLIAALARAISIHRFRTDSALLDAIGRARSASHNVAKEMEASEFVRYEYALRERDIALAKVIGPITGFILTVASLVAGLHPSSGGSRDAYALISSLQIAMIATLLGLLIRLAAEFLHRASKSVAERKLALLPSDNSI